MKCSYFVHVNKQCNITKSWYRNLHHFCGHGVMPRKGIILSRPSTLINVYLGISLYDSTLERNTIRIICKTTFSKQHVPARTCRMCQHYCEALNDNCTHRKRDNIVKHISTLSNIIMTRSLGLLMCHTNASRPY